MVVYYERSELMKAARAEGYLLYRDPPRSMKPMSTVSVRELFVEYNENGFPYYVETGYTFTARVCVRCNDFAALRLTKKDSDFIAKG